MNKTTKQQTQMLSNLSDSIKATLYDRVTSPLFGTFVTSWLIWNYKFILVLTSSLEVTDKFHLVDTQLYPSTKLELLGMVINLRPDLLSTGIVWPLISAMVFIIFYPIPARWFYRYWRTAQSKQRSIRQEVEDEELLTKEESRSLRRRINILEVEHEAEMQRKEDKYLALERALIETQEKLSDAQKKLAEAKNIQTDVKKFQSEIKRLQTMVDEHSKTPEATATSLSPDEKLIIKILSTSDGKGKRGSISLETEILPVKLDLIADNLMAKKYITLTGMTGGWMARLTPSGRRVAHDLGYI